MGQPDKTSINTALLPVTEVKKSAKQVFPPAAPSDANYKALQMQSFSNAKGLCVFAKNNYFLCFQILNPVWSCQWGLMEALDRRIPIWLADGQVGYSCITMSCLQAQFRTLLKQYKVSVKLNHLDQQQGEIIIKKKFISGPCAFMLVCRN